MNNNQERKKGSATPWVLGAGALGLGGIGLALASKGKVKSNSVTKAIKNVDAPKSQPTKLNPVKPQPNIQEELAQIRADASKPKAKSANMQDELEQIRNQGQSKSKVNIKDELDKVRNETQKPQSKPANMDDELGKIRGADKAQPTIKEEVAALKDTKPKSQKQSTESNTSGYLGLSKKDKEKKLIKRRRDLAEGLYDTDPNFDVTKKKDPYQFGEANGWEKDPKTNALKRKAALQRMTVNSNTILYGGSDSSRIKKNKQIKNRNEQAIKRAKQIAKAENREYNANLYLLCDI